MSLSHAAPFFLFESSLEGCENVKNNSLSDQQKAFYVGIGSVSMVAASFVAWTIFANKKLSAHPSKLIGYMSLCEAISCFNCVIWAVGPQDYICYFGLHYLFFDTVPHTEMTRQRALTVLCESNQMVFSFFQVLSLAFNFCLCHDLVATLRNPFKPGKSRMPFYLWGSLFAAAMVTYFSRGKLQAECGVQLLKDTHSIWLPKDSANLVLASCLSIYILTALYSCVYAMRRLARPGMSKEIRQYFLKKHVAYVFTFIFIWTFFLASAYYHLYLDNIRMINSTSFGKETLDKEETDPNTQKKAEIFVDKISIFTGMMTGMIMAWIRCTEPYFQFVATQKIMAWFGEVMDEKKIAENNQYMNDSLMSFLTSSMNIELVHVILKSISTRTSGVAPPPELAHRLIFPPNKYHEKNVFTLDSIKIRDADKWAVVKLPDLVQNDQRLSLESKMTLKSNPGNARDHASTIMERHKYTIINEDITVEEYAPDVFAHLRQMDGIDKSIIKQSLLPKFNRDMVFKAGESQGKSGSFFFFSHDKNFIIKTMSSTDYSTFVRIFPKYHEHVQKHPMSLLARIYGVFTVKMEETAPVNLILMGNTKQSNDHNLEHVFDLKGSMVNREVKNAHKLRPTATLKDKNLLALCKAKTLLRFKPKDINELRETMERDVEFLRSFQIMDYSLLFAIEKNANFQGTLKEGMLFDRDPLDDKRHKFQSETGRFYYHLGIIDYLQDYNLNKRSENFFKMLVNKADAQISAIHPDPYSSRYLKFMFDTVIIDQTTAQNKFQSFSTFNQSQSFKN